MDKGKDAYKDITMIERKARLIIIATVTSIITIMSQHHCKTLRRIGWELSLMGFGMVLMVLFPGVVAAAGR